MADISDLQNLSAAERQADILSALQAGEVPHSIRSRLGGAFKGTLPWTATLTPAELLVAR